MKFTIRTFIWSAVFVALVLAAAFAFIPRPIEVEVAEVVEGPLRVSVREDGKTRIREKYIVSAPVSGRLSRIELHSGDEILGDETLIAVIQPSDPAMLDARSRTQATARVRAAEATLQRSEANAEQIRINHDLNKAKFERAERLFPAKGISRSEYDIAKAEFLASAQAVKTAKFDTDIAQFELQMAEAAVRQFNGDDADALAEPFEIHAPISGEVLRVFQESSQVVNVGTPLLELGDTRNLEIEIDVLSSDAVRIEPGAELTIEHWGGDGPLEGIVRVIEPAAFTKISSLGVEEQRVNVIADFNEPPTRISSLGDGYRIEARITVTQLENVTLVPNSALFRHQREWHVLKVENGTAVMQKVDVGVQNESSTQIIDGLKTGDVVIVYPSDEIEAGTKVKFE